MMKRDVSCDVKLLWIGLVLQCTLQGLNLIENLETSPKLIVVFLNLFLGHFCWALRLMFLLKKAPALREYN